MNQRLEALLTQIRLLEEELVQETKKKEAEFGYEIHGKKIQFTEAAKARHKQLRLSLHRYLLNSRLAVFFTGPFIWICLFPIMLLDAFGSFYQAVCFPIYGIPKAARRDYLKFDRHRLTYLNFFEKFYCAYCTYANGVLAYLSEIAARTEQHWCPIKHAGRVKNAHSRYENFFDFGDAEKYRAHVEEIRRAFQDIESPEGTAKKT